jgi:aspartyl-tRNA(Asn)/glutamyl-tRNA(Gln) amidotransferase subunit A
VAAAVEGAVERLRAAGLAVARADPLWPPGTGEGQIVAIEESHLAAQFSDRWRAQPELFDPHIGGQIDRGLRRTAAEVAAAHEASLGMAAAMARFFEDWDLLLCPTLACVAWPLGRRHPEQVEGRPSPGREHAAFTPLFNHARTPALTLPCGAGHGGLPVGLQVVGPRFADRRVLRAGIWMEAALGPSARPWLHAD